MNHKYSTACNLELSGYSLKEAIQKESKIQIGQANLRGQLRMNVLVLIFQVDNKWLFSIVHVLPDHTIWET